jgi:hypothetical protein
MSKLVISSGDLSFTGILSASELIVLSVDGLDGGISNTRSIRTADYL